jgi:FixJ family two-component response regulator
LGRNYSIDSVSVIEEWTTSRGKSLARLKIFTGSRSVAKELCLSVETISSYRTNIPLKTRMKNNAEIIHYAIQNQLVD